jgi:hypothetical protein
MGGSWEKRAKNMHQNFAKAMNAAAFGIRNG